MQSHILLNGNIMESFTKGDQAWPFCLSVVKGDQAWPFCLSVVKGDQADLSVCQLSHRK
jgi:hypothetical protein